MNSATTVRDADAGLDDQGPPKFFSVAMQCNSQPFRGSPTPPVTDAQVGAIFKAGTNNR